MVALSHDFPQTVHAASSLTAHVIVQMNLPVQQLSRLLVLLAVAVVQDGRLADGHADDRGVLEGSGATETVTTLRGSQQNGGDVVDLMSGLGAGALLRSAATPTPALTGVQDQREEKDEEKKSDQTTLDETEQEMYSICQNCL